MERWRNGVGRPVPQRCREHPSFSSTLLDAIYRSIDETDESGAMREQRTSGAPNHVPSRKKQSTACAGDSGRITSVAQPMRRTGAIGAVARPATSSSSDGSSYGSFSSSEAEPVSSRLRPIRTSAPLPVRPSQPAAGPPLRPAISPGGEENRKKADRRGLIRSRLRDLRKGSTPASPGARLANFLNSLFASKSKVSAASGGGEDSACSTASSYSRSCLSKTPSSRGQPASGKRTVRFCPVSVIVGEDCRPCGQTFVRGGNPLPPAAAEAAPVRKMLGRSEEEEEEDEDLGSDSSSDLFELENLGDELPVYETTHLASYSVFSHA